jgi:hypothetical protein
MFKKGENPFAKGGKEDEDREDGKRKKSKRKSKRVAKGR